MKEFIRGLRNCRIPQIKQKFFIYLCLLMFFSLLMQSFYVAIKRDTKYLIKHPGCLILDKDPFDSSILQFEKGAQNPRTCNPKKEPPLFLTNDNIFWAKKSAAQRVGLRNCFYVVLAQGRNASDPVSFPIGLRVEVNSSMVAVHCVRNGMENISRSVNVTFMLWLKYRDPELAEKKERAKRARAIERNGSIPRSPPFNIHFIFFDGVSRLNSIRYLKDTRRLLKEFGAIEFLGYTKVAPATLANVAPLLTGSPHKGGGHFDEAVWFDAATHGFWSLASDDWALGPNANFDFHTNDYDWAPLLRQKYSYLSWCDEGKLFGARLWEWFENVLAIHRGRDDRLFSFVFACLWAHDRHEQLVTADEPTSSLLRRMNSRGDLDDSVLFVMSDHGPRFGDICTTPLGRYEQRHPFFFLLFPPWFQKRFPELVANAWIDSQRLTTPYDVHETLLHLLHIQTNSTPWTARSSFARSLMTEISGNRTCEDARVPDQFCGCRTPTPLKPNSREAIRVANAVVKSINDELRPQFNFCAELNLERVMNADLYEMAKGKKLWAVSLVLRPESAVVTGLARLKENVVFDDDEEFYVSFWDSERIDSCGKCGSCIKHLNLSKSVMEMCVCK